MKTPSFRHLLAIPALLAAAAALAGCGGSGSSGPAVPPSEPAADGPAWFEDVTARVGIDFTHDPGPTGTYFLPQVVGSGCAVSDLDGDGRPDVLLLTNGGPAAESANKLYRQRPDGTFEDASTGSGLSLPGHFMGAAVGDVDNDGRPDVLLTRYGGVGLYMNRGGMRFADATAEAGLRNPLWATSVGFLDYDRDGWLDVVVVNYLDYDPSWDCAAPGGGRDFCAPKTFVGTASKLFRNLGTGPDGRARFEDATVRSGVGRVPGPGLGVACADFDGDGWADVFVANDGKPNHLWVNRRDGTFREEGVSRGVAYTMAGQAFAGMGVALGDADNDGLLDLFVTHLTAETNTLWRQGPRGLFRDETAARGAAATAWRGTGFGAVMADFDLDGFADVAVANGRVSKDKPQPGPGVAPFWEPYAERNQLLANDGGRRFRDVSASNGPFCGSPNVARGLAVADLDQDGAPDLVVTTVGGPARVYRNVGRGRGHWLAVRCLDPAGGGRDAYGAGVTVHAGGRSWMRVVNPGGSYLSSGDPIAHFGLGAVAELDRVSVQWPDGTTEEFPGGPADRALVLRRGEGRRP